MIPQAFRANLITAVATPILFYQNFPLQLEYGTTPDLNFLPEISPIEGCMHNDQIMDSIRHVYLGKQPLLLRQCTRCSATSQIQNMIRSTAIKAWEQRWIKHCPCGGTWRIRNMNE